jgi:hypothetical protein
VAQRRPPDVRDSDWEAALAAGHAAEALRLGWPEDELFRVPKLWSQNFCGAALLIGDREVTEITASRIGIKTSSGAPQGFYRKPQVDYGVAHRARIKSLGDDGLKEEFQLRALEHTVNLYLANHPGAGIDAANAAVRDIIQRNTKQETTP